jgi:hypothetical protein
MQCSRRCSDAGSPHLDAAERPNANVGAGRLAPMVPGNLRLARGLDSEQYLQRPTRSC